MTQTVRILNPQSFPTAHSQSGSMVSNGKKKSVKKESISPLSCALGAFAAIGVVALLLTPLGWGALGVGVAVWIIGSIVIQTGVDFLIQKVQNCFKDTLIKETHNETQNTVSAHYLIGSKNNRNRYSIASTHSNNETRFSDNKEVDIDHYKN